MTFLAACLLGLTIQTSLYDLVGSAAEVIPEEVRTRSQTLVPIVVSADTPDAARQAADQLEARIKEACADDCLSVRSRFGEESLDEALAFVSQNRAGLASPADRELLATPEGRAKLARRRLKRLFADPTPTLFPLEEDPFGLAEGFVRARAESGQGTDVFVLLDLKPSLATDTDGLITFKSRLDAVLAQPLEATVTAGGVPLHTATAAARCKTEISILGAVSFVFIVALALVVFRPRPLAAVLRIVLTLVLSALAGGAALVLFFPAVHLLTLVFGTTLLGLVIDYAFHWLLRAPDRAKSVRRSLLVSWATTEVSFLPLFLSSLPVLKQSALFLGIGLTAALLTVLFLFPRREPAPRPAGSFGWARPVGWCVALAALGAAFGCGRLQLATPPESLYSAPPELARADKLFESLSGLDYDRRAVADDIARLYDEQGPAFAETLGLPTLAPPPDSRTLDAKGILSRVLTAWTRETLHRLGFALALMLVLLGVLFRFRALKVFLPSLLALAAVAGTLGWRGEPLTLFHALAAFLLVGMSLDYTVFLQGDGKAALRPALCSLLTSCVGFGLLAFVSFPVVRAFGVTLGIGLPVAFAAALVVMPGEKGEEPGASLLGFELLWLVYCLFGLRFFHFVASTVGVVLWLASPKVRRASPRLKKLVNFTRSLADKAVVMAQGRRLPTVETDGSPDAESFVRDVAEGKGVFVLSSHVGTIEVLAALKGSPPKFHAWMEFERTAIYNRFYSRHAKRQLVEIHPISSFGPGTVFFAGDALDAGECLLMAGDRTFGRTRTVTVGSRSFDLALGAFRFAAALDHPVYFACCLSDASCHYTAVIRRLSGDASSLAAGYAQALAELTASHPDDWFVWT